MMDVMCHWYAGGRVYFSSLEILKMMPRQSALKKISTTLPNVS